MSSYLDGNLAVLRATLTADRIRSAAGELSSDRHCETESRSGLAVTGIVKEGRKHFFHSVYDPLREADRIAAGAQHETAICLGFGTGHHLPALLRHVERLIVLEPDLPVFAHALTMIDLSATLADKRLVLLLGDGAESPGSSLASHYLPALHGSASLVVLPGRTDSEPERFASLQRELATALEAIANDFAVQARFGRNWMRNSLINVAGLVSRQEALRYPHVSDRDVIVTAAGPSLPSQLSGVSREGKALLIATDTSLPTVLENGIRVDAAFAVDCQASSYLHFLTAGNPEASLIADLAVPQSVMTGRGSRAPVLSMHPLHQLLHECGASMPSYDSSGGNVTHAAVSFALAQGARSVRILGADLAYPDAESYARGSYVHTWFQQRACRLAPLSSQLYAFAVARPGAYRDPDDPSTVRVPVMDRYRDQLARLVSESPVPVVVEPPLDAVGPTDGPNQGRAASAASPSSAPRLPRDILDRLRSELLGMDERGGMALLPLVAWFRRSMPQIEREEALARAREEMLQLIKLVQKPGRP